MLTMTKQRRGKTEKQLRVVKTQVPISRYMNFAEGTFLTRFTTKVIII